MYLNFDNPEFSAATVAAAQAVANWLQARYGNAAWFVSSGVDTDEGGVYAYATARAGVAVPSLPAMRDGVPIKLIVQQETQAVYIERGPSYDYPYPYPWYGAGGGGHGGHHQGGHGGHHGHHP